MKTSPAGRKALEQREGVCLSAYRDSVGVWTIGVGHAATSGVEPIPHEGMRITAQQADELLTSDLARYEDAVNSSVKVPLTQGQFDALVSLCFNIGQRGFMHSTVVARLNQKDYLGAADAILMWQHPAILLGRRKAERAQFLSDTHVADNSTPKTFDLESRVNTIEQNLATILKRETEMSAELDALRAAVAAAADADAKVIAYLGTIKANLDTVSAQLAALQSQPVIAPSDVQAIADQLAAHAASIVANVPAA